MNKKKILLWLGIILLMITSTSIGYMLILDVSYIDALYMTIITISTVGYKEVADMNTLGKIYSIVVILVSISLVGYILSSVFNFLSEGNINESWRKKKMIKEIEKMKQHIIICGAGESGIHVVKELTKKNAQFVVIEKDPEVVEILKELNVKYIMEDATFEDALLKAGLLSAKGLITTLSKDADNVCVVLTARVLNPELHIIARCHEEQSRKKLIRAGADYIVSPDEIGGKKMANLMLNPNIQFFVDNIIDTKNVSIDMEEVEIRDASELIGNRLRNTKISEKAGLIVLAIRRNNDEFIFNPKADEELQIHDHLIVVGSKEQIQKLTLMAGKDVQ